MQEPVNFSPSAAYPTTTQELAVHLLNNLHSQASGLPLNFDMRASSLPRECFSSSITGQTNSLLSNTLAAFPSNALLAVAAAAAFSMKPIGSSITRCLREPIPSNNSPTEMNIFFEKAISGHAFLSKSQQSAIPKSDVPLNAENESDNCSRSQSARRNSRTGERARRSRVVIHQFGDAEDHFSKALRNLHVKSAGEYELLEGMATTPRRVWKVTNTLDDEGESLSTSLTNPYFEAQNIAELAVEKHFEKSLATFHAKQAAAAASSNMTCQETLKSSMNLNLPQNRPPFSPSSSSNSNLVLLSPREDPNGCFSFNPKKKWLAQYGDDEVARTDVDGKKNDVWDSKDSTWSGKITTPPTNIEQRSKSCPLLANETYLLSKASSHNRHKHNLSSNRQSKLNNISRASVARPSVTSLHQRDLSSFARAISLEMPSLRNSIDFFDDEDEAIVATKSISAQESPVSSPIAASSGFFTDSTYSLDSSNLPVISEVGYFSSNASVSSSFQPKHLVAPPRENLSHVKRKETEGAFFDSDTVERGEGNYWPIRKRTASDASDLSTFKRSRSIFDAGCVEHS